MESNQEEVFKRMQIKVLYSFNDNSTVFLSRSKTQYSVKIAQIPMMKSSETQEDEFITLGAFDLKNCTHQILKSSPENFRLNIEDYAVYYKDITEQPDEPFVSNGVMSSLLNSSKSYLIPGRVCQNLSASYLFGDKANASSLTLEIRLKLHTIEKSQDIVHETSQSESMKRPAESTSYVQKKMKSSKPSSSNANAAIKATRTKSLPIFYNPHNQQIFNIMNADKSNAPSKYDSKSVQDRFKLAPFLQAKVVDNPLKRRSAAEPQRAIRTRSMVQAPVMISSPINEEMSDATDDTEYRETNPPIEEEEEEEEEHDNDDVDDDDSETKYKNYNKQSHNYKSENIFQSLPDLEDLDSKKTYTIPHTKLPKNHGLVCTNSNCATTYSINWRYFEIGFHPNHLAIHRAKEFDKKHYEGMFGPLCNACYLFLRNKGFMRPEGVVKKYLQQQKYKELKQKESSNNFPIYSADKNAYNNTQNYDTSNHNLTQSEENSRQFSSSPNHNFLTPSQPSSLMNKVLRNGAYVKLNNNSHYNNVKNNYYHPRRPSSTKSTPNCTDLNEFMNQLNNFGGPLTDIDPLPQDQQGISPPMMATKSNTRVINLYDDGEDKENCPPQNIEVSPTKSDVLAFEKMMVKSFNEEVGKSSPLAHNEWINDLFGEQTPKDMITPRDNKTPKDGKTPSDPKSNDDETESEKDEGNRINSNLPQLRTFTTSLRQPSNFQIANKKATAANMPSSPLISTQRSDIYQDILSSDPNNSQTFIGNGVENLVTQQDINTQSSPGISSASRLDTTTLMMSWLNSKKGFSNSTPNSEFYSNDDLIDELNKGKIDRDDEIEVLHHRS